MSFSFVCSTDLVWSTKFSFLVLSAYSCESDRPHGDLFTNEENLTAKTPPGDFQVITPETPLLSQQAVNQSTVEPTVDHLSQYPIRLVL